MPKITPFLWYDTQAEEAAALYVSVFPNSKLLNVTRFEDAGPAGNVQIVNISLDGQGVTLMNAGPEFKFNESFSFEVHCKDQEEVDRYWNALTANGGEESMCGWLKDRFGLSWQIVPDRLNELLSGSDAAGAARAMQAMLGMQKLVVADLEKAYAGTA